MADVDANYGDDSELSSGDSMDVFGAQRRTSWEKNSKKKKMTVFLRIPCHVYRDHFNKVFGVWDASSALLYWDSIITDMLK